MKYLILASVLALSACATSSHVVTGAQRSAISPDQVRIYGAPPETKWEQVAVLEASSAGALAVTSQGKTDKVVERLKKEAASLGANGIIIQGMGSTPGGAIYTGNTTGSLSSGVLMPAPTQKAGSAIAIYVYP